ncbi:DnaD domain-containing protein [Fredinandcohnia quinoae]|uniref:DnaD domain-containing protein n=1 Tax=Fredinandcohnia quinoae TaxID=2918902 RepID=A0AAW5E0A5_9BACI|nr:DnaD domain-containing protein [Fredinandcohnia sp. SECRCQ15]MCH1624710.1 DnaD domain-containing protein [Fredinandcohnia sp. SECRCQ15]
MSNEKLIDWLEQGNISIPKLLMISYKQLNINEEEMMLLLHILTFIESGNRFPTPIEIASRMTFTETKCTDLLRQLIQRGFLEINEESDENHIIHEKYSLRPLWDKMLQMLYQQNMNEKIQKEQQLEIDLYSIFEQEFGRPLSPFECESLSMWIDQDHHDPIIIKAALREAVISGKMNFRYIDRILFEWKKNGIRTIEQAQSHSKKFRQSQQKQRNNENQPDRYKQTIPFYNWLEN